MSKISIIVGVAITVGISFLGAKGIEKLYAIVKKEWDKRKK